tara:strand:+ start:5345 stop:6259 length:915 start_codon:yes stop_codon:yes gene_type:complete
MILVLGDILLDKFLKNTYIKKSPEANIPIVRPNKIITRLGGAANLINNINTVCKDCIIVSRIGIKTDDDEVLSLIKNKKIKYKFFKQKNYSVGRKSRFYIDNKQILRTDDEKIVKLNKLVENQIIKFIKKKKKKFSMIVISDYNKGIINKNLYKTITQFFLKDKKIIITNPKKKNLSFYNGSNIIVPNQKEFDQFFPEKENFNSKIKKFFLNKNLKHLIITRGDKNLIHFKNKKKEIYKVKKVKTFDVTGASDTFVAILALSLFKKNKIEKCIKLAIMAATRVVQKKFTSVISKKEFFKLNKNL